MTTEVSSYGGDSSFSVIEEDTIENLKALSCLDGKQAGWIRADLTLGTPWRITQAVFSILTWISKNVDKDTGLSLKKALFRIDLEQSRHALQQIQPQLGNNLIYRRAVENFNLIASAHQVEIDPVEISAKNLISSYRVLWNPKKKSYEMNGVNERQFRERLEAYHKQFPVETDFTTYSGFIEKKETLPDSNVFVRADLHGDLRSLLENLNTLKEKGVLDENFKCRENSYLVFLGDYGDRGPHSCQVIEILAALKMENPNQVFLLRGNHEYLNVNSMYSESSFSAFLRSPHNAKALEKFYQSLPLSVYMTEEGKEKKEYVHFTHAMFDLFVDPSPLLDTDRKKMDVPKWKEENSLSSRIQELVDLNDGSSLCQAAKRIQTLVSLDRRNNVFDRELTAYNWGDVTREASDIKSLGKRKWKLSPEDIRSYMLICSDQHSVQFMFRGHQHKKEQYSGVTTLPIGMDGHPVYNQVFPNQSDETYLLKTAPKVTEWQKAVLLRNPGEELTEITRSETLCQ
ncbi:MAG: serine/threonine protein phosphatase [Chlamydiales bacterium]|nr:serine/threonine protein phosphatase [Chlamydiales bacterium]